MGWLSGYQYRKKVTISGSSGAGENYQVKLTIGSSSGGDFHLEGHCVDFPNDIRFTDDDGETLLDYWIEDPTQDPITVWVEVKDSLDNDVDIFVYYNNPSASSASDGDAVFEFFDDFVTDLSKWVVSSDIVIENNALKIPAAADNANYLNSAYTNAALNPQGTALEIKTKISGGTSNDFWNVGWRQDADTVYVSWHSYSTGRDYDLLIKGVDAGAVYGEVSGYNDVYAQDEWHRFSLRVRENTLKLVDVNNPANELSSTDAFFGQITSANVGLGRWADYGAFYVDYIFVRKYADPEPTFSSAGSEEENILTCVDVSSFSSLSSLNKITYPVCLDTFQSSDISNSLLSLISCSQDTLGLTDVNTVSFLMLLNALDTVYVSDECTLTFEISPSCLETLRLLESSSSSLEGLVRCLDNIGTKTSLSSLLSAICQSSDNIGGIDSELSHMLISSILTDKLHSQDASVSSITFGRSVLDILVCQDTSSLLKGIILSATDILNAQDLTEIHLIISSSSIDIVRQRDTSVVNVTFHLSGEDIFKGEDFVSSSLQTVLSALDSFKVSDNSLSGAFAEILASASDILATSDYNEIHFEFLQSVIDIIKSDDASSPVISFQLNIVDILQGLDTLTANLQAILSAISKFKSSGETSSYEVMLGIPIKIFKAQEKVLVFRAKKKPFRFQVR